MNEVLIVLACFLPLGLYLLIQSTDRPQKIKSKVDNLSKKKANKKVENIYRRHAQSRLDNNFNEVSG